jgi:hypothetical protein
MQRITAYLYPNRITVLTNLDDNLTNTEWRIVYQRNIKIYKGIDNTVEIELKNNDQKRVEIGTDSLKMTLMDQTRNKISEYTAQSLEDSTIRGLARINIPASDLEDLDPQYLKFIVTKISTGYEEALTYTDSQYGAIGTIELLNGMNTVIDTTKKFDRFTQVTNYTSSRWEERKVYYDSEAISLEQYRARPINNVVVNVKVSNFLGEISVEGTDQEVIGNEAFSKPKILFAQDYVNTPLDGNVALPSLDVTGLTYIRVKYSKTNAGKVDYVTVTY